MKKHRTFAIISISIILGLLSGCNSTNNPETTTQTSVEITSNCTTSNIDFKYDMTNPVDVVHKMIEEKTIYSCAKFVEFKKAEISKSETERVIGMYKGSELAMRNGWNDDLFDSGRFIVVYAEFFVEYDNERVPYIGGDLKMLYYLVQDELTLVWYIVDCSNDTSWMLAANES